MEGNANWRYGFGVAGRTTQIYPDLPTRLHIQTGFRIYNTQTNTSITYITIRKASLASPKYTQNIT